MREKGKKKNIKLMNMVPRKAEVTNLLKILKQLVNFRTKLLPVTVYRHMDAQGTQEFLCIYLQRLRRALW